MRFSYSLVPLGFGMWLSHYSFHFLGSYETVIPAMQRFIVDLGCLNPRRARVVSGVLSTSRGLAPAPGDYFLDLGLLLSLYTGYRIALNQCPHRGLSRHLYRGRAIWYYSR